MQEVAPGKHQDILIKLVQVPLTSSNACLVSQWPTHILFLATIRHVGAPNTFAQIRYCGN